MGQPAGMTPELIAILAVGVALAGLILTNHRTTRAEIARLRGEIAGLRDEIARPFASCQSHIAARVLGPNRPSGGPGSKPSALSPFCTRTRTSRGMSASCCASAGGAPIRNARTMKAETIRMPASLAETD